MIKHWSLTVLFSVICSFIYARPLSEQTYPRWLDDAVIYHVYPSSFMDSDGDGYGDLEGIRSRLYYIKDVGFNTIWISPIFCSEFEDGGYDITDFYNVDPRFGTNEDLVRLLNDAHSMGIRICLDLVAGHTSDKHPWFRSSAYDGPRGRYADYYIWTNGKEVLPPKPNTGGWVDNDYPRNGYYMKNYYDIQPSLNYGYLSPDPTRPWEQSYDDSGPRAVRQELKNIISFWCDKGVDGFRCDLAWSLVKGDDKEFTGVRKLWDEIFMWTEEKYPEVVFLSEWSSPIEAISCGFDIDIIRHNGCGKTMYRDLMHNTKRNIDKETGEYPPKKCWFDKAGEGRFDTFVLPYTDMYQVTKGHGFPCMPTSSHDTWRMNRNQRSSVSELKTAMTFFLTMPWVPIIYYGEEIGMRSMDGVPFVEGSRDRSAQRTPMQWTNGKNAGFSTCSRDNLYLPIDSSANYPNVQSQIGDKSSLLNYTKGLISLRKTIPALGNTGEWRMLSDPYEPYPVVYERSFDEDSYLVVLNPSNKKKKITLDLLSCEIKVIYGDCHALTSRKVRTGIRLKIDGTSAVVCRILPHRSGLSFRKNGIKTALSALDDTLAKIDVFRQEYDEQLRETTMKYLNAPSDSLKWEVSRELYWKYYHYQLDSAYAYMTRMKSLATTPEQEFYSTMMDCRIYSRAVDSQRAMSIFYGMADVAKRDSKMANIWYSAGYSMYNHMLKYNSEKDMHISVTDSLLLYQRKYLSTLDPSSLSYRQTLAHYNKSIGRLNEARIQYMSIFEDKRTSHQTKAVAAYNIASIYKDLKDVNNRVNWLVKAAIEDLQAPTRDYLSLYELVQILYEYDKVDLALKYISYNLSDAVDGGFTFRVPDAGKAHVTIAAVSTKIANKHYFLMTGTICVISILVLVIIGFFLYSLRQNRRLKASRKIILSMNKELKHANKDLQKVNIELTDANKIKDNYVFRYMEMSIYYLNKLVEDRHQLRILAKTNGMDEMMKILRSPSDIYNEYDNFYKTFDETFLGIYPDFVAKVNVLLKPEARFEGLPSLTLTKELRILAAIRLGIRQSRNIAIFLNCPVGTVYTYRTNLRNASICSKDEFEKKIMNI